MRLADFILANVEPILSEWEVFARSIWPTASALTVGVAELRDDAEAILRATASDMRSDQSATEQSDKSKGQRDADKGSKPIRRASETHGSGRVGSGFDLSAVVAEYRALRASVLRLWRESEPKPDLHDIDDITRFNECIDQSLAEAVRSYTEQVERDRDVLIASEKAIRTEAEQANRAKDMFLATLSHEMRTPLNAIVGWMTILRSEGCDEKDLAEGLDVIDRNTKAQVQLIDDILDVSRIVSGKMRVEIAPCDLCDAINAGIDSVRPAAEARDITIKVQLDPTVGRATCDATRMQQVVWNLVNNAVKFTPKGGHVTVAMKREQSSRRIEVSDNGQGISAELLPYVFERFRQADSSSRRKFGGLGLGLSIVKHLVEAHGGTVEAKSEGEGKGSTFIVRMPIRAVNIIESVPGGTALNAIESDPAFGDEASLPLPLVRLNGIHVLVVDDDPDARRIITKVLTHAGAIVTSVNSAASAIEVLAGEMPASERPRVVLSDLGMPDMDGLDFIRAIRKLGHSAAQLPAIALTAYATAEDESIARKAGFQVHISKPVDPYKLTSVIADLVKQQP